MLLTHPSVAEAAVIGRPDPKWQEVPAAYVVLRAGMSADAATLKAHVAGELARFKVPRDVMFVDSLPRNVMGKVQHFRLRVATAEAAESAGCGAAKVLSRLAAAISRPLLKYHIFVPESSAHAHRASNKRRKAGNFPKFHVVRS